MSGLSDAQEVTILNSAFAGTLYLRFLTGTAGQTANDDGTLPSGCTEVTGLTFTPTGGIIPGSYWNSAVGGSPTTKSVPRALNSPISASKGTTWTSTGYCWTSSSGTISSANLVSSGVWVDTNSVPIVVTTGASVPFEITSTAPIIERLGDPPPGVNPT